jgi:uncharacterized protein
MQNRAHGAPEPVLHTSRWFQPPNSLSSIGLGRILAAKKSAINVVLDTNVFVAAGFNSHSHAARIVAAVRAGQLRMVWNEATRSETQYIIEKIPPLAWSDFAPLFRGGDHFDGPTEPEHFVAVSDPDDRKFAALALAAEATLVTQDEHLLSVRDELGVAVLTPREFGEGLARMDFGA